MRAFPAEFSDLLNAKGRRLIGEKNGSPPLLSVRDGIIDASTARDCARLLDRHLYPRLTTLAVRIPDNATWGMKRNYTEKLPKAVSLKTCYLRSGRFRGYAEAEKIGLVDMLRSGSLHQLAESMTGLELWGPGLQVICYEHGDYSGPHNDHHPESPILRHGYVDLHITFSNDAVDHQWLVYEEQGHLSRIADINLKGAVSVYRLPFWHYTTPLAAKPGREKDARRWLLLVSFNIAGARGGAGGGTEQNRKTARRSK